MSDDESDQQELDISNDTVVTKYKTAAGICNRVMTAVVDACKPGALLVNIANLGDDSIENVCQLEELFNVNDLRRECGTVYRKDKDMDKGIAFPTCLSVDHCVGHYSPDGEDKTKLKEGAVVKIDLGAHIDGFVAVQATTLVVQSEAGQVTGRAADAIACASTCFEAALRLIRPGKRIWDVAGPLGKIAESYGCTMVEGVMTHNMKQFVIDGNKCVLNKPTSDQKVEDGEFLENEVYAVDIVVSTGEGKARMTDEKATTVYKRALGEEYKLRMKSARNTLTEVNKRYPCMPFPLRKLLATGNANKFGLVECTTHGLLQAYPVLWEKDGHIVAHIKGTVLLMPNGSDRITTAPLQDVKSEKSVDHGQECLQDEELKALLAQSIKTKKKSASKRKKPKGVEGEANAEA